MPCTFDMQKALLILHIQTEEEKNEISNEAAVCIYEY